MGNAVDNGDDEDDIPEVISVANSVKSYDEAIADGEHIQEITKDLEDISLKEDSDEASPEIEKTPESNTNGIKNHEDAGSINEDPQDEEKEDAEKHEPQQEEEEEPASGDSKKEDGENISTNTKAEEVNAEDKESKAEDKENNAEDK